MPRLSLSVADRSCALRPALHDNEFDASSEQGNEIGIKLNAFSRYVDNDFLALKIYRDPAERNGCDATESERNVGQ